MNLFTYWYRIYKQIVRKLYSFKNSTAKIRYLRSLGQKIGEDCLYLSNKIATEPYLIEIGDHVVVSSGSEFITHDGSVWLLREENPDIDVFGQIKVGDNTFIGIGCIILPGTKIGKNCIIGAGSVVRGDIADNSVVIGNPAKVIMKTTLMKLMLRNHKNSLKTKNLHPSAKTAFIKKHFNLE